MFIVLLFLFQSSISAMENFEQDIDQALRSIDTGLGLDDADRFFLAAVQTKNIVLMHQFIRTRENQNIDINKPILDLPPLYATANSNFLAASKLLLKKGAQVNTIDKQIGFTALYYARYMSPEHIALFRNHGAEISDELLNETLRYVDDPTNRARLQAFNAAVQLSNPKLAKDPQGKTRLNIAKTICDRQIHGR